MSFRQSPVNIFVNNFVITHTLVAYTYTRSDKALIRQAKKT